MTSKKDIIFIIDDDRENQKLLHKLLILEGYKVELFDRSEHALTLLPTLSPQLFILGLQHENESSYETILAIHDISHVPIIVVSAPHHDKEIVKALKIGADDYITKPFNPDIFIALVEANIRKSFIKQSNSIELSNGKIRMNLTQHRTFIEDKDILLTPKEYDLLKFFLQNLDKVITHTMLLETIWGPAHRSDVQYLRVYISQLREKIEIDPKHPDYIESIPGIGYRMLQKDTIYEKAAASTS